MFVRDFGAVPFNPKYGLEQLAANIHSPLSLQSDFILQIVCN
jgi:hypothetical protein